MICIDGSVLGRWLPVVALIAALALGVTGSPASAQDQAPQSPSDEDPVKDERPPIERIDDNVYKIGNLVVDGNKREVVMPGWINMSEGVVELLACAPGGKTHESVVVVDVEPFHLQIALLLLGLEGGESISFQGDPATPEGDPVEIVIEWTDPKSGEMKSVRGEDFIYNVKADRPMIHTHWVFTGSRIVDGVFVAQMEKSLVTTYHDPYTIIDNPLQTGGDDTYYEANRFLVPPVGTKVTFLVRATENASDSTDEK
ncbi:MAG: hypothetical protein JSV33_12740 [bacterium]|nr:MAG: hypothetical protein JSV33_12740 [bacterium]